MKRIFLVPHWYHTRFYLPFNIFPVCLHVQAVHVVYSSEDMGTCKSWVNVFETKSWSLEKMWAKFEGLTSHPFLCGTSTGIFLYGKKHNFLYYNVVYVAVNFSFQLIFFLTRFFLINCLKKGFSFFRGVVKKQGLGFLGGMKKEWNSPLLRSTCPTRPSSSPIAPILPHPFFTDLSPFTFQLPDPPWISLIPTTFYSTSDRQFILSCQDFSFYSPELELEPLSLDLLSTLLSTWPHKQLKQTSHHNL